MSKLTSSLSKESERVGEMWRMNCAQVTGLDEAITEKDMEIVQLKARVSELEASSVHRASSSEVVPDTVFSLPHSRLASGTPASTCQGKAPPVSEFSGEDPDHLFEDWLPALERASL